MTSTVRIGLNILDWLLFSQTLVHCTFTEDEKAWLDRIVKTVGDEIMHAGITGQYAEVTKHYVYCLLEITSADMTPYPANPGLNYVSREIHERGHQHEITWFSAFTLAMGEKAGNLKRGDAFDIASRCAHVMTGAPAIIRQRLTERLLAYEYPDAMPIFLTWMKQLGIMPVAGIGNPKDSGGNDGGLVRVGLLCEFTQLRSGSERTKKSEPLAGSFLESGTDKLPQGAKEYFLTVKHSQEKLAYKSEDGGPLVFYVAKLHDADYIQVFLSNLEVRWEWMRLHPGNQRRWLGTIGAFYVQKEKVINPQKPIFSGYRRHFDNAKPDKPNICTEVSKRLKSDFDLTIAAKTLSERHTEFLDLGIRVAFAYRKAISFIGFVPKADMPDATMYTLIRHDMVKPVEALLA